MNRPLYHAAFLVGLAALCWLGAGYARSSPLALLMLGLIAGFYLMGALELHRFRQATASLHAALAGLQQAPAALEPWLDTLHPSLRHAVRLRIEGERAGLPAPALTPYLAGLLVLLGMLGTFLGMVVTLDGTGLALERAADVQAIRASLAAPVKGLGLAFGTSVAGVAASAMLGLMSALCRRERLQASQRLDARIATTLRGFTLAHQREESLKLMQLQAQAMPALVGQLQAMMGQIERQAEALNARLLAGQDSFHGKAEAAYAGLAASVGRSLHEALTDSARSAGAALQPVAEATMAGIARQAAALHQRTADTVQGQLDGLCTQLADTLDQRSTTLLHTLEQRSAALLHAVEQRSAALLHTVDQSHAQLQAQLAAQDAQRLAGWTDALQGQAQALQREWETQTRGTLAEIGRLVATASEAPRAAAEVITQMRQQLSDSLARDHALLEERARVMQALNTLLEALQHSAAQQQEAGVRVADGALEVARLGEAFGAAVQRFIEANQALGAQLQRIEGALDKSLARSDEQLAYYVAQAREIVDLSILSQQQIMEQLQRQAAPAARRTPALGEA